MSEVVSIERDGPGAARAALERCVLGGGVAVFPADGLYGLACDPLRATAIERIHEIKGRDDGKPSAVMYFSPLAIRELVGGLGPRTKAAVSALMPGPVTLVVANLPYVPAGERSSQAPEITKYEPEAALFAGAYGLDVVRELLAALAAGGAGPPVDAVALEIGAGQASPVRDLVRGAGFERVEARRDLAGIERGVIGRR